jgi:hypothetical protein
MFRISERKISEIGLSNKSEHSVAHSLKARIVESQQLAVTMQRPLNNRGMVFSAQSVLMAAHAAIEYIIPLLSNNFTATEEQCFLCSPCQDVISRNSSYRTAAVQSS